MSSANCWRNVRIQLCPKYSSSALLPTTHIKHCCSASSASTALLRLLLYGFRSFWRKHSIASIFRVLKTVLYKIFWWNFSLFRVLLPVALFAYGLSFIKGHECSCRYSDNAAMKYGACVYIYYIGLYIRNSVPSQWLSWCARKMCIKTSISAAKWTNDTLEALATCEGNCRSMDNYVVM